MNPRTKRILTMAIVVVLVAALVWFLYPRSFAQAMGRTFDRESTCTVQAVLRKGGSSMIEVTLSPEDPAYGELMALLESKKYVCTPDREWQEVTLDYSVTLAFGREGGDNCLDFTGEDAMRFYGSHEKERWYRVSGAQAFQQEILDLLLAQPYTTPS